MKSFALLSVTSLALIGCAAPGKTFPDAPNKPVPISEAGGFECDAASSQSLIGQKATRELGLHVVKNSGAQVFRWFAPGMAATMEYNRVRVNVAYDEQMIVTSINCG